MMKLKNKVAIVTGSGRGIGKSIAAALAKEGAKVVLCSRSEAELKETAKEIGASYCVADVAKISDVKKLISTTLKKFKQIDILVTAAGVYGPKGLFHNQNLEEWKNAFEINILGTINVIHEAIPHMKKGVVVALAGAGVPMPFPRFTSYSTSKAAIVQFISTISKEYSNIRFNAIAPGAVATKLIDEVVQAGPEVVGKEFYDKNVAWKQGKGSVSPEVAAEFIVRLCSDDCKISGKYLSAVWDKNLTDVPEDIYTLRRIDGVKYVKKD